MKQTSPVWKKCTFCKRWFMPEKRNRQRQRVCARQACKKARQAQYQRRWHAANPGYWGGPEEVERVRQWRKAHPQYWKRCKRRKRKVRY